MTLPSPDVLTPAARLGLIERIEAVDAGYKRLYEAEHERRVAADLEVCRLRALVQINAKGEALLARLGTLLAPLTPHGGKPAVSTRAAVRIRDSRRTHRPEVSRAAHGGQSRTVGRDGS